MGISFRNIWGTMLRNGKRKYMYSNEYLEEHNYTEDQTKAYQDIIDR